MARFWHDFLWSITLVVLLWMMMQLSIERSELRKRERALASLVLSADSLVTYWKTLKCIPRGR